MSEQSRADGKAAVMRARAVAAKSRVIRKLGEPENMPGFMMWQVGEAGGMQVVMPDLVRPTPEIAMLYTARIIANATGWCPECDAVASDEASHLAGTSVVHAGVFHASTCPTLVLEREEAKWFDPRAIARLHHEEDLPGEEDR